MEAVAFGEAKAAGGATGLVLALLLIAADATILPVDAAAYDACDAEVLLDVGSVMFVAAEEATSNRARPSGRYSEPP